MWALRIVAALTVLAIAGVIGPSPQAAEAAYSDCPSGYHCWFSGGGGAGHRWQVSGTNSNLSGYGIATRSNINKGTSGLTHCGFRGTHGTGGTATKTNQHGTSTYSLRAVNSNKWIVRGAPCAW